MTRVRPHTERFLECRGGQPIAPDSCLQPPGSSGGGEGAGSDARLDARHQCAETETATGTSLCKKSPDGDEMGETEMTRDGLSDRRLRVVPKRVTVVIER
jgi:hypothetical protein